MKTQLTMQSLFASTKEAWIEEARETARMLLRSKSVITIEDVLEQCPRPEYLHRNTTGAVFNHPDFVHVGYTRSKRAQSNGRAISKWARQGMLFNEVF